MLDPKNLTGKYIEVYGVAVPETDLMKWAEWMEAAAETNLRAVRQENVGPFWVSTVFLGLDHNHARFFGKGPHRPLLYETMAKEGDHWLDRQDRYSTRAEALAGHYRLVEQLKAVAACREQEQSLKENE